jgi:hypothetical protein
MKYLLRGKTALLSIATLAAAAGLAGCSLGTIELSGAAPAGQTNVSVALGGTVHGGQQPIAFSTIQLYAVGTGGYGAAANLLSTSTTHTYYPGGTTGCSNAALALSTYAIAGGVATYTTSANTLIVGQLVTISDSSPITGGTYVVSSATSTSFSVTTANTSTVGTTTDSGTATPTCYNNVVTDYNGNFSITGDFTCGTNGSSPVYLIASGGNPGYPNPTTSNSALKFVSPILGTGAVATAGGATGTGGVSCSNLSSVTTNVYINEVTTAAAAYAMGQYFGAANDSFSSASTLQSQTGLSNAFATAANLVNIYNGGAVQSLTLTGASGTGTITAVPEFAKLITVANILASCANSLGASDTGNTSCSTLFGATGASATPANTLEAAVDISLNPNSGSTANITTLYNLSNGIGSAFTNGLTAAPGDWTLGIAYTGSTTNLPNPYLLNIDAAGNVWVINNSTGLLTELTPNGTPAAVLATLAGLPLGGSNPKSVSIDSTPFTSASTYSPTVWVPSITSPGYIFQYNASLFPSGGAYQTSKSPYALTIDANDNVFVGNNSSSTHFSLDEIPAATTILSNTGSDTGILAYGLPNIPSAAGATVTNGGTSAFQPQIVTADINNNVWISSGQTAVAQYPYLVELTAITPPTGCVTGATATIACFGPGSVTTASPYLTTSSGYVSNFTSANYNTYNQTANPTTPTTNNDYLYTSANLGGLNEPIGLAAAQNGGVWAANLAGNSISLITSATAGTAYGSAATLSAPHFIALDGSGNVWVSNKNGGLSGGSAGGSVSEFSSNGTAISPASSNTTLVNPGYVHNGLNQGYGIAVDPSGNVWVADDYTNFTVEEIVGAATPVVTPIALQLKNGTTYPGKP